MAFSVDVIPNRSSPPAILLREAWREGKRVRRRTVANLSKMPPALVDAIRAALDGGVTFPSLDAAVAIRRSRPHGHVAAVLGTLRALGLVRVLGRKADRMRDLAVAAVVARVVDPASKLATARALDPETASTSLGTLLGLGPVTGNEMLDMLDWLLARQPWIERSLANRHLKGGNTLILYDVSSSYLEGRKCPLAAFGHNRDGKRGKMQVTYGLLCAADGCPVAVEVFAGNAGDPSTVASQVDKVRSRFGIGRVALVGDRGMLTTARIREDLEPSGLDWISALKTGDIRKLLREGADGAPAPLEPEALVPDAVAEVTGPDFPGERLMVCLNPRLRQERARKREELLKATEEALEAIAASVRSGRLKGREAIDRRVGRDANRRKVGKHFEIDVTDGGISWRRPRGPDRRRGAARRRLRDPHQPGFRVARAGGGGGGVQEPRAGGARVPDDEGLAAADPSGARLVGGSRPRPCVPLHACVSRGMAHAPAPGADPVRGRRPRGRPGAAELAGGARQGLGEREGQGGGQEDPGRASGPQPHDAARRPGHADAERGDAAGQSGTCLPAAGDADGAAAPGL